MSETPHWSAKADNKRKTTGKAYAYRYTLNNDKAIGLAWERVGGGKIILSDFLDAGMSYYLAANGIDFEDGVLLPKPIEGSVPALKTFGAATKPAAIRETDINKIKDKGKKYSYRYSLDNARAIALLEEIVEKGTNGKVQKIPFISLVDEAMRYYCAKEAGIDWDEGAPIQAK